MKIASRKIGGVLRVSQAKVEETYNGRLPIVWTLYSHPYGFVNPYLRSKESTISFH